MDVMQVITAVSSAVAIFTTVLYARRAKKAEVRAKEAEVRSREIENARGNIGNAEAMIELVQKANAEAAKVQQSMIETLKTENGKFKKYVEKLERAFRGIHRCPYRDNCPVYAELQGDERGEQYTGCPDRNHQGGSKGHCDNSKAGSGNNKSPAGV